MQWLPIFRAYGTEVFISVPNYGLAADIVVIFSSAPKGPLWGRSEMLCLIIFAFSLLPFAFTCFTFAFLLLLFHFCILPAFTVLIHSFILKMALIIFADYENFTELVT